MSFRVLVFSTPFCANCKASLPFITKGCEAHDVELAVIDATTAGENVIALWDLKQVPTTIAVRVREDGSNGEEIDRISGLVTPSSVEEFLLHIERTLKGHE